MAEVVSAFHQDTHAVHSHNAYHQQAEGTHLGIGVAGERETHTQAGIIRSEPNGEWICK